MQKQTLIATIIFGVGVVTLLLGVAIGWFIVPAVIKDQVKKQTRLIEGSDVYEKWVNIPVPISMKFTFFNVTNADDLQQGWGFVGDDGEVLLPKLEEVGPYTFTEVRIKYDIEENKERDTIFYRSNVTYYFDSENSVADDKSEVTIINMPLYVVLTLLRVHIPRLAALIIGMFIPKEDLFHTVNAVDVAMRGVLAPQYVPIIVLAKSILNIDIPSEFQGEKFGLWLPRNGTNDGIFEVGTGISDSSQFNVIKSVNGNPYVTAWKDNYCNKINGTDGMMFPPFIKKDTILYAFGAEICRSIYVTYKEEMELKGIPGYRFSLPRSAFENPMINGDNLCFCTDVPAPLNNSCNAAGGIRMHSCKQGAPVIISKPHFLDADEEASAGTEGLLENRYDIHDSFIDVEPNTGFPLAAYKRVQASLEIQPLDKDNVGYFKGPLGDFSEFGQLPHMFMPIVWVAEEGELTEELADEIKSRLITPMKIVNIAKYVIVGVGALLILFGAVLIYRVNN